MTVVATPMSKTELAQYVQQNASRFNLDPAAVMAVAGTEGYNGGPFAPPHPDPTRDDPNAYAVGPWQFNSAGKLPANIRAMGPNAAQVWAWSTAGADSAMQQMADKGAAGLSGYPAVTAIQANFEVSNDIPGQIARAWMIYGGWAETFMQGIPIPGVVTPTTKVPEPTPGTTDKPVVTTTAQPAGTLASGLATLTAGLLGPGLKAFNMNPDMSALILLLASIFAIIIGALIWRGDDVKGAAKAAPSLAAKWVMFA